MDISIPSWLAYVLIVGKLTVYVIALYMFVRSVARVEISRALAARDNERGEEEEAEEEPAAPRAYTSNITINVDGIERLKEPELRALILKVFADAANVTPKDGAS